MQLKPLKQKKKHPLTSTASGCHGALMSAAKALLLPRRTVARPRRSRGVLACLTRTVYIIQSCTSQVFQRPAPLPKLRGGGLSSTQGNRGPSSPRGLVTELTGPASLRRRSQPRPSALCYHRARASLLRQQASSWAAPPWNRRRWAGPPGMWGLPAPALSGRRGPRKTCPATRNPPFSHKARSHRLGGVPCRIIPGIRHPWARGLQAFRQVGSEAGCNLLTLHLFPQSPGVGRTVFYISAVFPEADQPRLSQLTHCQVRPPHRFLRLGQNDHLNHLSRLVG